MARTQSAAEQKAFDDYVSRVVAAAPPLSPAQLDRIAVILRPGSDAALGVKRESPKVMAIRAAESALTKARQSFRDALDGCHGCGLSPKVHGYQKGHAMGFHDFQELTPEDAIKVSRFHGKKIAAAESALGKARAA